MKNINVKWAKSDNNEIHNFGDDLNPYIINKLSGLQINYIHFANTRINIVKEFIKGIFTGKLSSHYLKNFINSFFAHYYIIAIGSILQWYGSSRCIVWGSGIIKKTDNIKASSFLAVRGEYTRARLKELGYLAPQTMGDPALLLPLVYKSTNRKKYQLGIIPHVSHYAELKEKTIQDDVLIIDLGSSNIEKVIEDINSCQYTISSSLHGIIVSHAYNIKSLWIDFNDKPLAGDNVKFLDYFSSVHIPEYEPFHIDLSQLTNIPKMALLIEENNHINKIQNEIKDIQKNLLRVCPFPLKPEFKV